MYCKSTIILDKVSIAQFVSARLLNMKLVHERLRVVNILKYQSVESKSDSL